MLKTVHIRIVAVLAIIGACLSGNPTPAQASQEGDICKDHAGYCVYDLGNGGSFASHARICKTESDICVTCVSDPSETCHPFTGQSIAGHKQN